MIIQFFTYSDSSTFWFCPFESRKLDLLSRPFKRPGAAISVSRRRRAGLGGGAAPGCQEEGLVLWRPVALGSRASAMQVNLGRNDVNSDPCSLPDTINGLGGPGRGPQMGSAMMLHLPLCVDLHGGRLLCFKPSSA